MDVQDNRPLPVWRDPWVWGILALALLLRAIYLVDLRHTPFFAAPQMDAWYHDAWARRLAAGDWWGSTVFFRAPLYPYFLGVLYALFGPDYLLVRIVQFALGAATALITTLVTYRRLGRFGSVLAGGLVALHGPLIYFEGELLLVVLEAPLNLLTAWSWVRARERADLRSWALAGAILALGALVRPTLLAVLPFLAADALFRPRARRVLPAAAVLISAVLVLSPVLIRNYAVGRDWVPVASQGGLNYYLGNHAGADGMAALAPEFRRTWTGGVDDARQIAEEALGGPLKPSEVSRFWFRKGLAWAREDPGAFLRLQVRKLATFWDAFEVPNNQDPGFFSRLTRLFQWSRWSHFGILGPLALAGLVIGVRRRRLALPWIAVPGILMAVIVAFFVCGRFRVALVPLFAIWAGAGPGPVLAALRQRDWRLPALYAAILIGAGVAMNADLLHHRARWNAAESHLRLGIFHASRGEVDAARAEYRSALEADPTFADGWNNLGVLDAQEGNLPRAEAAFRRALALDPGQVKALGNLAALLFQTSRGTEADSLARHILELPLSDREAVYNAAVVLGNLGDAEAALRGFRLLTQRNPADAAARAGEVRALLFLQRPEEARRALRRHPDAGSSPELKPLIEELEKP